MPIYEYSCSDCQTKFEVIRPMKDADLQVTCKTCDSTKTHRVLSLCYSKSEGRSTTSSASSGCGGCSGGSCSSCNH